MGRCLEPGRLKRQKLALTIYKVAEKVARTQGDISNGAASWGSVASGARKQALKFLISYLKSFPSAAKPVT